MEKRLFKKYFKLPLKSDPYSKKIVWTTDNDRAFDFKRSGVSPEDMKNILDKLNGEGHKVIKGELTHSEGIISLNGEEIITIRSWGRLTGTGGGLGLSVNKACEIQDDFCDWIIEKLKDEERINKQVV